MPSEQNKEIEWRFGQRDYYEYDGLPMTAYVSPPALVKFATEYDGFREDDLIVYTYPKAGKYALYCM